MGLDMFLTGEKFLWGDWKHPENNPVEDGFKITKRILELGYWRKHPDLHGFIVETFAEGKDDCQDIWLSEENLQTILEAVKQDKLPHTEGFFFGQSTEEDKQPTIEILENAIKWARGKEKNISRSVYYRASW